jgi:excisionase family DNA binding protein
MLLDEAVRSLVRDEVRTVLRDELRAILREELLAALKQRHVDRQSDIVGDPSQERYVDAVEAGTIAGVRPSTVRSWVERGHLKGYRSGRLLRVRLDELKAYLGRSTAGADVVNIEGRVRAMLAKQKSRRSRLPAEDE